MSVLILTVTLMATIMFVMAVGVIVKGRALKGSCGGVGSDCACETAGEFVCDTPEAAEASADMASLGA